MFALFCAQEDGQCLEKEEILTQYSLTPFLQYVPMYYVNVY